MLYVPAKYSHDLCFDREHVLLMYRIGSRLFTGDLWVGIGGHFEDGEMSDPRKCVLRELKEETGLNPYNITDLALKYITTRKVGEEIRQQYIFTAELNRERRANLCAAADEGELSWIPLSDLFTKKMTFSNTVCLKHYLSTGKFDDAVYSVVADPDGASPFACITALKEYKNDR